MRHHKANVWPPRAEWGQRRVCPTVSGRFSPSARPTGPTASAALLGAPRVFVAGGGVRQPNAQGGGP